MRIFLALVLLPVFSLGCLSQPAVKVSYYQLEYAPPVQAQDTAIDTVVGVRHFGIASAYDHDRLIEREKDLRMVQSYYHRWVGNPRMMLSDLLLRDLRQSGAYRAVVMIPANVLPQYEVNGFIQEIAKDNTGAKEMVSISMEITLLHHTSQQVGLQVLFQKSYQGDALCEGNAPSQVARAMSLAYRDLSGKIQSDIRGAVQQTSRR